MTSNRPREALKTLTVESLESIAASAFGFDGFGGAIAYYDPRKDELVTKLASFPPAVQALEAHSPLSTLFGVSEARRVALQFVFNAYARVRSAESIETAFETVWNGLVHELETPTWTLAAVANIQNLECSESKIYLTDGISVRGRSFEELGVLLAWGPLELDFLAKDWMTMAGSSFVLYLEKKVPKTPDNFLIVDDGTAYTRAARALLALRLVAPGDIRIGRLFLARPAKFNVGIGGMQSNGFSVWHPGPSYHLAPDQVPKIRQWYDDLTSIQSQGNKQTRSLALALRSFSSIYDRYFHQAEDRILDAITTLEALWKLDAELAFRLSFRTASLLGDTDDDRAAIYETVTQYYKIRSKIVHGSSLADAQASLVREDEPLRGIVRRALRAFVHLANNPGEWTLGRVDEEADSVLLHATRRESLRKAMGLAS